MKRIYIIFIFLFTTNAFALINEDVIGGCGNATTFFVPTFTPNTYTCQSGTFLPANTDGCRPCPNGYTCSGGTFSFNNRQSQGINIKQPMSESTQYTCSDNFVNANDNVANMIPVFKANTVNLTWNDGNGNSSSGTCTYDGLIDLPDEPTRPGYVFRGWQLQTNND